MISKYKMKMNQFNKRIKILNPEGNEIYECWSSVNQMSGTEIAKANLQFEQTTTRFLIRYTPIQITSDMTVEFAGYTYDIQYSNDYNFSHEYIEIIAIKRPWSVADES